MDLRSDTVTRPTAEMRKVMSTAEVGDDVWGDDHTTIKLEEIAAKMFGKEAALFVPSGTMGNLISVLVHCPMRGSEMILGDQSHIHFYEQGGSATLGGVHSRTVTNKPDGTMDLQEIEDKIRSVNDHYPTTRLICLENTHNRCNGTPITAEYTNKVAALAKKYNLKLHIDGARIFNAAIALGVPVAELCASADSVSVCLSKGLAAPIGSVIVGTRDFIFQARRLRKALGGGMRQVGIIASAGILAMTTMVDRLAEDHQNAALMSKLLSDVKGVEVEPTPSNLVFFRLAPDVMNGDMLVEELKKRSILCSAVAPRRIRATTHYQVTRSDVELFVTTVKQILHPAKQ